jgi:hypothetical protein
VQHGKEHKEQILWKKMCLPVVLVHKIEFLGFDADVCCKRGVIFLVDNSNRVLVGGTCAQLPRYLKDAKFLLQNVQKSL